MSAMQSVFLNQTYLKQYEVKSVATGIAVFRLKQDDHKHQYPVSMCEIMPPAADLGKYEIVGVLCDTFRAADLTVTNKMYNVAINGSTNVTLMLDDATTNKINFTEKIFFVPKTVPETNLPKGVYVATTELKAGGSKLYAGRIVMEYNRNPQRQITVNLNIKELP